MWGAARLDADTYEEVEADRGSLQQAAVVVVAAALAIGAARWAQAAALGLPPSQALLQVAVSVLEPLVLWVGGSAVALMVGATFFRGPETESDFAEVLRTTGFAFTPALLRGHDRARDRHLRDDRGAPLPDPLGSDGRAAAPLKRVTASRGWPEARRESGGSARGGRPRR
jgi:hypothetical protein